MSCAPSGATPTASTTPSGGWKIMPGASERRSLTGIPHGEPSTREVGSENYTQPGQNRVFAIERPHPCALSLELPGAERSGEGVQTKPRPRLYHSIQTQWSWMPASTGWLLLYCHEGKNPILLRFAPKAHFRNFLWWGRSMHLLDRSWPPVLGSGVRHVLEESFLNFSRVTELFS